MPRISQGFWKFLVYVWETDALVLKSEAFMPFLVSFAISHYTFKKHLNIKIKIWQQHEN